MTHWFRICLAGSFAVAHAAILRAHLGDTPAEADRSYGAGREVTARAPAEMARTYFHDPYLITAEFIDGRVRRISYRKSADFTSDEIEQLLAGNADGRVWTPASTRLNPVAERAGLKSWMRSDRGAATMKSDADAARVFLFTDAVFLRATLQAMAGAPAAAPSDAPAPKPAAPATGATAVPPRGLIAVVTGTILIGLGVVGSVLTFIHDAGRLRAERVHPQLAPKRVAPEVHFVAAVLAGAGVGLAWSWGNGVAWFVGHLLTCVLVAPILLRSIRWKRS